MSSVKDNAIKPIPYKSSQLLGCLSILLSAFFFYFATAVVRQSVETVKISSFLFIFYRTGIGLILVSLIFIAKRRIPRIKEDYLFLSLRVFGNLIAVLCFFKATLLGSAAKANILNLTYPLFIVLFLLLFSKGKKDYRLYLVSVTSFFGILLVTGERGNFFDLATLWGLISGATAAVAVIALARTRKYNDTETVLFYMFLGAFISLIFLSPETRSLPTNAQLYYLLTSACYGAVGQFLFTYGFRFVSAEEGGILSSTRILIAAFLGPIVTSDPSLTLYGYLGALIIFISNAYVIKNKLSEETSG